MASWTISVTNTGGNYVFNATVSDPLAPACNQTSGGQPGLGLMAPLVTVTYNCSQSGLSAAFTNTVSASAVGPAGDTVTASASATVAVSSPPVSTPAYSPAPKPKSAVAAPLAAPTFAALSFSALKTVLLTSQTPTLTFNVHLSKATTLVLTLFDSKGHKLASWIKHESSGTHKLALLLPHAARYKGHETLKVTETGNHKAKTLSVLLAL